MNRSGLLQNYGKFCHAEFISSSNSFQNLTIKDPETSSGRQSSEIYPSVRTSVLDAFDALLLTP